MRLAAAAWRLRQAARRSVGLGDFERAVDQTSDAQRLHRTSRGEALRTLSAWLKADRSRRADDAHSG